ncbi:sigma-70 family RNA polymerase sigma factor [Homoserinimonas sp. A520]
MDAVALTAPLPFEAQVDSYRRELIAYCYRYFGCYGEAEDAVQETMMRAWQRAHEFEGRSSLRTWLYAIATNICLDMKRAPQRRSLPTDFSLPGHTRNDPSSLTTRAEATWVGPIADSYLPSTADPADVAAMRESIRLAFVATLQLLPPRQRVILILRDVLAWSSQECADLLEASVAAVNSALARARATMVKRDHETHTTQFEYDEQLLMNYVDAFESYDVDRLVALLAEDAVFTMPPFELWLRGAAEIERWWQGPGEICRNSRTIPTRANGQPAVAVYHDRGGGVWEPFAIHLVDFVDGRIASITHFMGPAVFDEFGLPSHVTDAVELVA